MTAPAERLPTVAVLGASGLIGQAVARDLTRAGFPVVPVVRRFTPAQKRTFGAAAVEAPFVALPAAELRALVTARGVDIVVNCVGVLQDDLGGRTDDVHRGFVARLVEALGVPESPRLLVHLSIPGWPEADETAFSRTKRAGEDLIASSDLPFVVLRPGFVIAPAAYGGSALVRSLAALPFDLPVREAGSPFATTAIRDIARTVAVVARRWQAGERRWGAAWDLMERHPADVGTVVDAFRDRIGGPRPLGRLPAWTIDLGARAGDLAGGLGWRPPIRSTALREMRRGVAGDPGPWTLAIGFDPASRDEALAAIEPSVQELWFARLYLLKPLILVTLVVFWVASGLISLTVAFDAAVAILIAHGFPEGPARAITAATSLCDVAVGAAIAVRPTCRPGLLAGIALALSYMAGAAALAPDLWADPLGALVKTGPAIVLMAVALAILDDR